MPKKLQLKKKIVCGRTIYEILDQDQRKAWGDLKGSGAEGLSEKSLRQLRTLGCRFQIEG